MPSLAKIIDRLLVAVLSSSGLYITAVTLKALGPKGGQSNALARIRALPLFAWHPLSASLAALVLAPASYLYIRQRKATQPKQTRSELAWSHAALTGPSVALLSYGVYAIYRNKSNNKWPHLVSLHSYLGTLALAAFLASTATAAAHNLGYPGKIKAPKMPMEITWNSRLHRWLGAASIVTSGLAVATGVTSKWGRGAKQFGSLAGPLAALVASSCLLLAIDVARFVPSGEGGDAAEGGQEEEKKQA